MGKLRNLSPLVGVLKPRLARLTDDEGHSPVTEPWRKNYTLPRWRDLRLVIFTRDRFKCQMCGKVNGNMRELTCDHVEPHRGDEALFWDEANLQTLCTSPCHNQHKQALERAFPT
jgi:5-methylcytosine-specific restriction endonuclease McrA